MKPSEMTDEQLRIKVAELLGWTGPVFIWGDCRGPRETWRDVVEMTSPVPLIDGKPDTRPQREIPDFPHDLNACHEMEKAMPEDRRGSYALHLLESCGVSLLYEDHLVNNLALFAIAKATARQRCEAFVEVMGK